MNTNSNTLNGDKTNFEAGYGMLPANKQTLVRDFIMAQCGWNCVPTFHNKRKGITRIRPMEAEAIELQFAVYGIDPWTGTKITEHASF